MKVGTPAVREVRRAAAVLLGGVFLAAGTAAAQKVTAVPQLDLKKLSGTWYEVTRYPTKFQKRCAGQATVLFNQGDKPRTFQMGTFCPGKTGTPLESDLTGKMDKHGTGKLTSGFIPLFKTQVWVIALAPDYSWALLGQPKRKALSVLSRTPEMAPSTLTQIEQLAAAQGFTTDKLVSLPKLGKTMEAEDGKLTVTPPAPSSLPSTPPTHEQPQI